MVQRTNDRKTPDLFEVDNELIEQSRTERLLELQQAIRSGQYQADEIWRQLIGRLDAQFNEPPLDT